MRAPQTGDSPPTMTIKGLSFESLAMDTPLAFESPMRHLAQDPAGFDFYWKMLHRVFQLPDPKEFPPLGRNSISTEDQVRAARYVATAEDLARSSLLSSKAEATFSISDDRTHAKVERKHFPARDATVGFSTLFRQLYSTNEKSSFDQVSKIFGRANEEASDRLATTRRDQLKKWTKAHNRLKGYSLEELLGIQLEKEGKWKASLTPKSHDLNPQQLISLYFSGDVIHWGDSRDQLALFQGEPDLSAMRELAFLRAMTSIAHVHMGFAELVTAALSGVIVKRS